MKDKQIKNASLQVIKASWNSISSNLGKSIKWYRMKREKTNEMTSWTMKERMITKMNRI